MKDIVVGLGEVLWDMLPQGKKIGGAPANFAYHVGQFGLTGCVASAVGKDALGKEIVNVLNAKGINMLISEAEYPTGTVEVEIDSAGIPRYDIKENVAWDHIPFTPELDELARNAKAVCFGSLAQRNKESRATITNFLNAMPQVEDRLIVFDVNLRQNFYTKEIISDSLKRCNVLKINDEELEELCRMFGYRDLDVKESCAQLLHNYNLKILILTCGIKGSYVFTPQKESYLPTPVVEVIDTVGAGDSFTASFIASIIKGKSVEDAHSIAVRTSAYVCGCKGAMPELPAELTA